MEPQSEQQARERERWIAEQQAALGIKKEKTKIITKYETAGTGCFVQAIGLIALFFFPVGTIIGLLMIGWGSYLSKKLLCGNCKNKIESPDVTICPVCKEELQR